MVGARNGVPSPCGPACSTNDVLAVCGAEDFALLHFAEYTIAASYEAVQMRSCGTPARDRVECYTAAEMDAALRVLKTWIFRHRWRKLIRMAKEHAKTAPIQTSTFEPVQVLPRGGEMNNAAKIADLARESRAGPGQTSWRADVKASPGPEPAETICAVSQKRVQKPRKSSVQKASPARARVIAEGHRAGHKKQTVSTCSARQPELESSECLCVSGNGTAVATVSEPPALEVLPHGSTDDSRIANVIYAEQGFEC